MKILHKIKWRKNNFWLKAFTLFELIIAILIFWLGSIIFFQQYLTAYKLYKENKYSKKDIVNINNLNNLDWFLNSNFYHCQLISSNKVSCLNKQDDSTYYFYITDDKFHKILKIENNWMIIDLIKINKLNEKSNINFEELSDVLVRLIYTTNNWNKYYLIFPYN